MNKGLLEKFSGAAAAYSVRLLNRQYTGALMKIRRVDSVTSQDNGEIFVFPDNTGWVSLNSKVVDPSHASAATTLGGFVNALGYTDVDKTTIGTNRQHAYVVVWKDQSGNSNDASQGTTTAQPQLISAGTLIVENGKPAVQFDGSDDFYNTSLNQGTLTGFLYTGVASPTTTTALQSLVDLRDANDDGTRVLFINNGTVFTSTDAADASASYTASQQIITGEYDGTNVTTYIDGTGGTSVSGTDTTATANALIGVQLGAASFFMNGTIQELVLYFSDQSSNRTNIEDDINTAFNIYNNAPTPKKNSFLGKYPGAAAAYSTRNLTGKANQPLLKVRRELGTDTDTEETIYSSNNQLDTNQLLNFVNGVGEDPRPPLDISEGYGYSLRVVKSGYQGPLIEVRESSGNTTKDFYADSTGRINEQALLDFCGANDGHVSKWYNQSGVDRHLTSDAAANEPKIVESGVVVKDTLGNVAIKFTNAGDESLAIEDTTTFDLQEQTIAMHFMPTAFPASGLKRIIGIVQATGSTFDSSIRNQLDINSSGLLSLVTTSAAGAVGTTQTINSPSIITANFKGSSSSITSSKTTGAVSITANSIKGLSVGDRYSLTSCADFLTSEVIQYTSAQIGDNKNEVEASLNKHYKIYGDAYVSTWYDQSTAASDNLLLDDNPDAAAAYSLRKLRELYQGSAINVRRDSDNATKNIGFTSSGELDVNELINFCSGTNGFVTTWYNQAFTSKNELLLDTTEGSGAAAAYSVRQLSSTATECMVIRRSSDGKTRTIGFKDTHIDEAAIESFCSGTTCTVQTWKDQSGNNNDATQSTPANQPTIYTGGAIVKENGRVAVDFDGVDDYVEWTSFTISQPLTAFGVQKLLTSRTGISGTATALLTRGNTDLNQLYLGTSLQSTVNYLDARQLISNIGNSTSSYIYSDGVEVANGDAGTGSASIETYPTNALVNIYSEGIAQELIFYASDKSTDRTSIESNINNYYGIFSTNNAEQDVALSQPKIYDSSTGVVTEGTKPAINLDSNDFLDLGSLSAASGDNVSYYWVGDWTGETSNNNRWILHADDTVTYSAPISTNGATTDGYAGLSSVTGYKDGVSVAVATRDNVHDAFTNVYHLGELYGTTTTAFSSTELGRYPSGNNFYLNGNLQEFILYTSDQSSRRLNIESNINNHYRIYSLNDATQATATSQPQLVSNGRVILENGKPAVEFDGTNDDFSMSAVTTGTTHRTSFTVAVNNKVTGNGVIYSLHDTNTTGSLYFMTTATAIRVNGSVTFLDSAQTSQSLATVTFNGTTTDDISLHLNGASKTQDTSTGTTINTGTGNCSIGSNTSYQPANLALYYQGRIQELVFYSSDQSTNRTGIESNINRAFGIYWDGTQRGLLDDQPNAAVAYSVRALSSSYTGPLVEIRDANGNTRDIYATYNGDLDEAAIEAFCSGTTCTIATWYDQSGNANNATQADALSQPTIYASGAIIKENGRPAVQSTTSQFWQTSGVHGQSRVEIFEVFKASSTQYVIHSSGIVSLGYSWWASSGNMNTTTTNNFGSPTMYANGTLSSISNRGDVYTATAQNQSLRTTLNGTTSSWNTFAFPTAYLSANDANFQGVTQELVVYTSDKSTDRANIERNINQYFNIYTDPGVDRLLNKYPGAAAAYSLRKLNSQYTGPAVRVRRDSDNVHADVYFDLNSTISKYSRVGVLSSSTDPIAAAGTTTLQTFMGSNNGFVAVWYDQASSNDASQSSALSQPKIYDSVDGVVTENGKPAVEFDGGPDHLDFTTTSVVSAFIVARSSAHDYANFLFAGGGGSIRTSGYDANAGNIQASDGTNSLVAASTANDTTRYLIEVFGVGASGALYLNSTLEDSGTLNAVSLNLFGNNGTTLAHHGPVQEVVFYTTDQSSNRTKIESDINNHYSIYAKPKKLLDQYGGAAAAYSLRSLHSNYTGPLVTIRRDSDGIEVDVYADLNGEFSLNSIVKNVAETTTGATQGTFNPGTPFITLSQFVQGSPNCYVVEWKDQSGNGNHATQVTAANQPKIYDSVTGVVTENAKPAMQFDGANDQFNNTSALTNDTNFFGAVVMSVSGGSTMFLVYDSNNAGRLSLVYYPSVSTSYTPELYSGFSRESSGQSIALNTQVIITSHKSGTQAECFANGQSNGASTVNNPATSMGGLSFGRYANNYFSGKLQEIIFYGDDQSSDRANIETNLNDFYGAF